MKHLKKVTATLVAIPQLLLGDIGLDWEYQFDTATIGQADHRSQIKQLLVSPSGHVALALRIFSPDLQALQRRVVLLSPDGNQTWMSHDLRPEFGDMDRIDFLHASRDSLSFHVATIPVSSKCYMYNRAVGPSLFSIEIPWGERVTGTTTDLAQLFMGFTEPQTSVFTASSFYTYASGGSDGSDTLRKYSLDVVTPTPVVVQSVTGATGSNLHVVWQSALNTGYQVQESSDLVTWTNLGGVLTGTGDRMSWSCPVTTASKYYRVTQQ